MQQSNRQNAMAYNCSKYLIKPIHNTVYLNRCSSYSSRDRVSSKTPPEIIVHYKYFLLHLPREQLY